MHTCVRVHSYVHQSQNQMGRVLGVTVLQSSTTPSPQSLDTLQDAAKRLAMHVVAARPLYLNPSSVPAEVVAKETEIIREQAAKTKKPADVIEKMVQGRLQKYFQEVVLTKQNHLIEEGTPAVEKVLASLGTSVGSTLNVEYFERFEVGK